MLIPELLISRVEPGVVGQSAKSAVTGSPVWAKRAQLYWMRRESWSPAGGSGIGMPSSSVNT
ncbi:hypothetical protein SAMN02745947_01283 [Rhodococcus rhodochrous J3]|uniref:Uncharacterized protein n=1 Tax=Rhodococcus rhodochrous J3 TaxID=903528 RepID=A0ABY1M7B8_RHORH|nr:hypothetical protein SAMN02745947_01283 [Rhodococcus rhodochrous J3]SNV22091.1 Uncharacterised protein [Rhodococcus rhodochrous]